MTELVDNPPPVPNRDDWRARLQWAIAAVPVDHPELCFLASLLRQAIERPGLTERQERYARPLLQRLIDQATPAAAAPSCDLRIVPMAGRA